MYQIHAGWSVKLYAAILAFSIFTAIIICPETTLSPSLIGALYPSRPIYQIGVACSLCPYLIYLILWNLKTKSRNIKVAGLLKFMLLIFSTFISKLDDSTVHGVLEYSYNMAVCYWMLVLSWKGRKNSVLYRKDQYIGFREIFFAIYVSSFLYSLHVISKFFRTGSGYSIFTNLRALAVILDILFDYMNAGEFPGLSLQCNWVHLHTA